MVVNYDVWPPPSVRQRLRDHHELSVLLRGMREDSETTPHLARYLVVRSTGLIEAVRDDVADLYCLTIAPPRVHRFAVSKLRNGTGVTPEQLKKFVGTFDRSWQEDLREFLAANDGQRSDNLGALVAARKKIAHGDGEQVTTSRALKWADTAQELAKWLVDKFKP